ncbi:MAG: hypothetical protein QXU18_00635 [Thermoplasmatales archaeon]
MTFYHERTVTATPRAADEKGISRTNEIIIALAVLCSVTVTGIYGAHSVALNSLLSSSNVILSKNKVDIVLRKIAVSPHPFFRIETISPASIIRTKRRFARL